MRVSPRHHPLAQAAADLGVTLKAPTAINASHLAPASLTFGSLDGDDVPEAVLAGSVLHRLLASDAGSDGDTKVNALSFDVPRTPSEYVSPNTLAAFEIAVDDELAFSDFNGDGALDVLVLGPTGSMRILLGTATSLRTRLLKCKFGGDFEPRRCWSCGTPSPPHQVPAEATDDAHLLRCTPPPLDGWSVVRNGAMVPQPRVYTGFTRVELTFNDQQWTEGQLRYEYHSPWHVSSIYPAAGPVEGGTFVQVRGMGLYASATGEANPVLWHQAFRVHDANADAQLEMEELVRLLAQLKEAGALP